MPYLPRLFAYLLRDWYGALLFYIYSVVLVLLVPRLCIWDFWFCSYLWSSLFYSTFGPSSYFCPNIILVRCSFTCPLINWDPLPSLVRLCAHSNVRLLCGTIPAYGFFFYYSENNASPLTWVVDPIINFISGIQYYVRGNILLPGYEMITHKTTLD